MHRFFAPSLTPGDDSVVLPRDEGEHLTRVLRHGVGDTVTVFDGRGQEFLARVEAVRRRDVRVRVMSRIEPVAEPCVPLTLVQAVLKADKMDDVVRDAVMLGVAAIQPVVSKHTETTVAALLRGARVERWRRVALASVKQSRRAVMPEVRTPLSFETWLSEPAPGMTVMLAEPSVGVRLSASALRASDGPAVAGGEGTKPDMTTLSSLRDQPTPADAALVIGPEGGWADEECVAARARGCRLLTLGHRTLRADAVPVAAISVLQFLWGDL